MTIRFRFNRIIVIPENLIGFEEEENEKEEENEEEEGEGEVEEEQEEKDGKVKEI